MIHATDLFRPPDDPDDHWDLATVYALAFQGLVRLKAIVVDFPLARRRNDPDALAVAQMNYLTRQTVPLVVGPPRPAGQRPQHDGLMPGEQAGVEAVLEILRHSDEPVVINITGSCRTIAAAGRRDADLFARQCAAIYLNAGTGSPDPAKARHLEHNVTLDPRAYAAIFRLPCPVYWMPCFEEFDGRLADGGWPVRPYGTYWRFRHADLLPHLSDRLLNYFTFIYRAGKKEQVARLPTAWLQHLLGPRDTEEEARQNPRYRNMWCTAGFLHAVGNAVTGDGRIVPVGDAATGVVATFDPVRVSVDDHGVTRWRPAQEPTRHHIFHVRDTARYQRAMTTALRRLLSSLP